MHTSNTPRLSLRSLLIASVLVLQVAGIFAIAQKTALAADAATTVDEQEKAAYVKKVAALKQVAEQDLAAGKKEEDVARKVDQMRRELNSKYYATVPAGLREKIHAKNLEKYGNQTGPSFEYFLAKGRSWKEIIDSASKVSSKDLGN